MTSEPRVTVIMVTFNSSHVLAEAIEHLPDANAVALTVVDNDSTDDSVDLVHTLRPDAQVIQSGSNLGFALAVNLGAAHVTTEFLLLLNPDAHIAGPDIAIMVNDLDRQQSIGVIAPLMTDPHGQYSTIAAGYSPTILRMALHASGVSRLGRWIPALEGHYLFRGSKLDGLREVDWVSGGCLMMRTSLWNHLGGLSSRWFMYAEDVEICLRARTSGAKVVLEPAASAIHAIGGSSKDVSGKTNPTWIVNLYDLYASDIAQTPIQRWLWRHIVAGGFRGRAVVYSILRRLRPARDGEYRAQSRRFAVFTDALLRQKQSYTANTPRPRR